MSEIKGVADHPEKDLMEFMWKDGLRAKAIIEYLNEQKLPSVSYEALARYGQRNWSAEKEEELIDDSGVTSTVQKVLDEIQSSSLGKIERVSISKTGYNISVKPEIEYPSELVHLPKVLGTRIPTIKARKVEDVKYHAIIPDTQIEPGRPNDHLLWISQYLFDKYHDKPLTLIHLGDHWNMGSLSSYDRGKGAMEGRRYMADIASGNRAFEILDSMIADEPLWDKRFLFGNHENRINRAVESDIQLEGLLTLDHCITPESWIRHTFLEPITIDGVTYAHYFYHPSTGRPYGGENMETRLKTIGHSFVMGHQQGLKLGMRYVNGRQQVGVVAGSCYQHTEEYAGPQGNSHWQGIVILNNVEEGSFDPMPVSLDFLCRKYEGHKLDEHVGREL